MPTEESRAVVLRFIEEALQGHKRERMDELIAPDYNRHMPGGQHITGRDPIGQSAAEIGWAACPDWSYEIEVLLAEGELVAVRVRAGGTHTRQAERGPWRDLTPDGMRYSTTWTAIYRVRDGKIVEQWLDSPGLPTASEEVTPVARRFYTGEVEPNSAEAPASGPHWLLGYGGDWAGAVSDVV